MATIPSILVAVIVAVAPSGPAAIFYTCRYRDGIGYEATAHELEE